MVINLLPIIPKDLINIIQAYSDIEISNIY